MECDHCGVHVHHERGGIWMARHSHPHCRHRSRSSLRVRTLYTSEFQFIVHAIQANPGPSAVWLVRVKPSGMGCKYFVFYFAIHSILYVGCASAYSDVMVTDYGVSLYCSAGLWWCGVMAVAGGTGGFYIMMARWWKYAPDVIRTRI